MRFGIALAVMITFESVFAADPPPDYSRGQKMLDAYFRRRVKQISDNCLNDIPTREEWERRLPRLRQEFLDMLGLWPTPPRTDLKATITGKVKGDGFTVEKLHFQSKPGLYVTGNLYVPDGAKSLPAILYVCGHGNVVKDGVSYGSKVFYQHHPAWFARHGYVCLILDTLELGEIPGEHHGTYKLNDWWWQSLGYTPAGVECWNAIRAIDYLITRPEVDQERIGVTGRSGGGATSWWIAAADRRPQCFVPVAGIADLHSHLIEGEAPQYRKTGVIAGHCDCMYMVNTYQWDFPMVAALCAPRPLMLGNSDADGIFPVSGYRPLAEKVRKIYDLYRDGEKFTVLETSGPHKDTPELRLGAFHWFNHWFQHDDGAVVETVAPPFTPQQLKVLKDIPKDAINARIQETFVPRAKIEMPADAEAVKSWWRKQREDWLEKLKSQVFGGWPKNPPPLDVRLGKDITKDGLRLRAFDFVSEEDVELRLWVETAAEVDSPSLLVLTAVDDAGWRDWLKEIGDGFSDAFPGQKLPAGNRKQLASKVKMLAKQKWAFATLAPRGIGPTQWAAAGNKDDVLARRRYPLIGQTLDGQRVWDIRRALQALATREEFAKTPRWLQGTGESAGLVLHAAIFEPDVKRIDLHDLPRSYKQAPTFLNIWRYLDVPQAVALALPRDVRLYVKSQSEADRWKKSLREANAVSPDPVKIRVVGD